MYTLDHPLGLFSCIYSVDALILAYLIQLLAAFTDRWVVRILAMLIASAKRMVYDPPSCLRHHEGRQISRHLTSRQGIYISSYALLVIQLDAVHLCRDRVLALFG